MLKAIAILAAGALCAPVFGASVTTLTDDYDTGSMTRSTWIYSPDELGLQARDLVPLPGMTPQDWQEALELEAGMPYWMTGQDSDVLAWNLAQSQGWSEDNYNGSDFNLTTGELRLFITEWTGESPWDYRNRTGISPWGSRQVDLDQPTGTFAPFLLTQTLATTPAAVPSPSALAAGFALAIAGTLRRRR